MSGARCPLLAFCIEPWAHAYETLTPLLSARLLGGRLVNKLQQICSSLGETALSENAVLWNKLTTIVCIGGQVGDD